MPMQPIHRLADLGQRPDGGVEWACPRCGRYLVRYPDRQLVVAAGTAGAAHVLGRRYRDDPSEIPTASEFDDQFLTAMPWPGSQPGMAPSPCSFSERAPADHHLEPTQGGPWRSRTPSRQRGGSTRRPSPCTARSPTGTIPGWVGTTDPRRP